MANPSLDQLRGLHLPKPISWWPLAPGWTILIGLIVGFIITGIYYLHKKMRNAKPKKQAIGLLMIYQANYEKTKNSQLASAQICELLKRVALVYFSREKVAGLCGDSWIHFLNQTSKGIDFDEIKPLLLTAPFEKSHHFDIKPLFLKAKAWIKQRSCPCSN
ncbi:MAG: DUF4381 domain-containing protein [Legionella sp.]|nr:DUF4381 domain-containing protein [Legionella sp.]